MKQAAIDILDSHRIMAVSTVRPDGWPQTTFVGYANEGFDIFFMVMRSSQKAANIARDGGAPAIETFAQAREEPLRLVRTRHRRIVARAHAA